MATRRKRKRTRSPEAKQRHRESEALRRAERRKKLAAEAEAITPAIQRTEIVTREGITLRGPLVTIVNGRPCRTSGITDDPLGDGRWKWPRAQLAAARMFQADHSDAGHGITAAAVDYGSCGGGRGDGTGRHAGIIGQIEARVRLEGALTFLGGVGSIVVQVVIDSLSPTAVARGRLLTRSAEPLERRDAEYRTELERVHAEMKIGLQRLQTFYHNTFHKADPEPRPDPILTFGPSRDTYSMEIAHETLAGATEMV